jgi:two-component system, NtrC family, response regulator HydG
MVMLDLSKNWKNVIDSLHSGVMVIDTNGTIRHVNPALEDLTGYPAGELTGNPCAILDCSGCEPWYGQGGSWCMLFGGGKAMKPMACRINSKSGYRLNVVKQASVFQDSNGVVVGAVETFWDMTKMKEGGSHKGFPETFTEIFKMVSNVPSPF